MAIRQISVFVENKQGALLEATRALAAAGIDLRAVSLADTAEFGILRMITSDTDRAREALSSMICSVTEVVGVRVPDAPGGLCSLIEHLAGAGINVEYLYGFVNRAGEDACAVLRVAQVAQAEALLEQDGFVLLHERDLP